MKRVKPCFNRAARFARLVARSRDTFHLAYVYHVSIGPRVSRGWWPSMSNLRAPSWRFRRFNRAARFARLVAFLDYMRLDIREPGCFNRAARFARLVASIEQMQAATTPYYVSIGPRVSRGWWP